MSEYPMWQWVTAAVAFAIGAPLIILASEYQDRNRAGVAQAQEVPSRNPHPALVAPRCDDQIATYAAAFATIENHCGPTYTLTPYGVTSRNGALKEMLKYDNPAECIRVAGRRQSDSILIDIVGSSKPPSDYMREVCAVIAKRLNSSGSSRMVSIARR